MTSGHKRTQNSGATADIRQKVVSETNMRILQAFPAFGVDRALPEELRDLLDVLDRLGDGDHLSRSQGS